MVYVRKLTLEMGVLLNHTKGRELGVWGFPPLLIHKCNLLTQGSLSDQKP